MFELGALTTGECLQSMEWVRFSLDTGAAQTAIPPTWQDRVQVKEGTDVLFKTASGETFLWDRNRNLQRSRRSRTMVQCDWTLDTSTFCLKHGRLTQMANVIPRDSRLGKKIMELIEKEQYQDQAKAWIPVYQEKGVYNF